MCGSLNNATRNRRSGVKKAERISQDDFDGESRKHRRATTERAKALSRALEGWLKKESRKNVNRIIREMRRDGLRYLMRVEKADGDEWDLETLLRIVALYGIRQINDSGLELAGTSWLFTPTAKAEWLLEKRVQLQRIPINLEKEMRSSVGKALGTWSVNEPGLTTQQVSQRLRSWLTVSSAAETPYALKPLGQRFTSHGLGARARMIARTETNQARNRGRLEAGKVTGVEYWMWLAETDGLSGDRQHEALDRQVRATGEAFENPATGAVLEYPGDPGAEPGEVINCRCSIRALTADQAKRFGDGV